MAVTRFEVLSRAFELISGGWCKHRLAADRYGESVDVYSDQAVAFCVIGGMARARKDLMGDRWLDARDWRIVEAVVGEEIVSWNNSRERTHAQVLMALRQAMDRVREEGEK